MVYGKRLQVQGIRPLVEVLVTGSRLSLLSKDWQSIERSQEG